MVRSSRWRHRATTNPVINGPLVPGGWNSSLIPDGDYELRLYGVDAAGNDAEAIHPIEIDNTFPVAEIASPQACEQLTGTVSVFGTATDANLDRWVLQVTGGSLDGWVTLATGTNQVQGGFLGTWDLSGYERCAHTLRLVVFDRTIVDGDEVRSSEALTSVYVGICGQPVQNPVMGG